MAEDMSMEDEHEDDTQEPKVNLQPSVIDIPRVIDTGSVRLQTSTIYEETIEAIKEFWSRVQKINPGYLKDATFKQKVMKALSDEGIINKHTEAAYDSLYPYGPGDPESIKLSEYETRTSLNLWTKTDVDLYEEEEHRRRSKFLGSKYKDDDKSLEAGSPKVGEGILGSALTRLVQCEEPKWLAQLR